ncbi:MAG: response regulator [Ferruginibacter sp.]
MLGRHHHIFLADDDADDCLIFEEALREINIEVGLSMANDGKMLMSLLSDTQPSKPDLIFLDLNMPLMNGFECLSAIRKDPELKAIPVIIFSTTAVTDFVDKAYDRGADFYVTKPESFSKMKTMLAGILSRDWGSHKAQPRRDTFVIA